MNKLISLAKWAWQKAPDFIIGVGVILFIVGCLYTCKSCAGPTTVWSTDTVYVKVTDSTKVYVPVPVNGAKPVIQKPVVKTITIEKCGGEIDTLLIYEKEPVNSFLLDYYSKVAYSDTFHTKYGYIVTKDTISENALYSRQQFANLSVPVVTNTVTQFKNRPAKKWAIGLSVGYGYGLDMKPQPFAGITLSRTLIRF